MNPKEISIKKVLIELIELIELYMPLACHNPPNKCRGRLFNSFNSMIKRYCGFHYL